MVYSQQTRLLQQEYLFGIPMFGDQSYNVEKYEYPKVGVHIDLMTKTEELLMKAIINVIGDDR